MLTELLERHAVASLTKQRRLARLVDGRPGWSAKLDRGWLRIGADEFALDVLGTESAEARTFAWAWANHSFTAEQTASARLLRRLGIERGVEELVIDGEIPLERIDSKAAGILGSALAQADAYFNGPHAGGTVVFLLRSRRLGAEPCQAADVASALTELLASGLPIDPGRAARRFLADPLPGFSTTASRIDGPGGAVELDFDLRGRIADVRARLRPAPPPTAPAA